MQCVFIMIAKLSLPKVAVLLVIHDKHCKKVFLKITVKILVKSLFSTFFISLNKTEEAMEF